MASKNSVFGKLIAVFLVLIIISGSGFLVYNLLSGSIGNMSSMNMKTDQSSNSNAKEDSTKNADTSKEEMNMDESTSDENMAMGEQSSDTDTQYSTTVITSVLQNKENLDKAIATLKDSLKLIGQDPSGEANSTNNNSDASASDPKDNNQTTSTDGNTVVNVYPQNSAMNAAMENMGTTYDAAKMEQLHTGFYQVAIGMQLLDQLKSNLSTQLEMASVSITNPSQYYNNHYLLTVQNKNKLNEALTYINEAGILVNTNPYVSKDGLVYDKDKMGQIHDSINKLAIAVVDLNKINDNFSQQSIQLSNLSQNSPSMTSMDMNVGGSFLSNMNMATVLNVLVVAFILIFFISIFGYISKLLKQPKNS